MNTRLLIFFALLVSSPAFPQATSSYLFPSRSGSDGGSAAAEVSQPAITPVPAEPAETPVSKESFRSPETEISQVQSPSYRLILRDEIQITVYGQPDLTVSQRIDGEGMIRVPLLGNVSVAGRTVRQLEQQLETAFIEGEFLRSPMVTVRVLSYAPREITIFGAVRSPGTLTLPIEVNSIDIVEVISKVGGFSPVAKSKDVRVVRNRGQTNERVEIVNVADMIIGRAAGSKKEVLIYPGDLIQVDQSLF